MPGVHLSQLYDVKNNINLDLQVENYAIAERKMALKHLNKNQIGDLVVDHRSCPAVWFYKYYLIKVLIYVCALLKALMLLKPFEKA